MSPPPEVPVYEPLRGAVEECALRHGAQVIDLILRGDRRRRVVEVFVDAEESITLDRCAEISRDITSAIESGNLIEGDYRLEVSSPGIDRPLIHPWQFVKHKGRTLRVTVQGESGRVEVQGTLVSVDAGGIGLEAGGGEPSVRLEFSEIREARVRAPW